MGVTSSLTRVPAGRVNGVFCQPGTVMGPKEVTREFVVVTSADSNTPSVEVGYATEEDLSIPYGHDFRSITEFRITLLHQTPERESIRLLFGGEKIDFV